MTGGSGTSPPRTGHPRLHRCSRVLALDDDCRRRGPGRGRPLLLAASADEAAAGADVVLLCTSAASPVVDVRQLAPGTLVTSVSTNAPMAHEIDPAALLELDVYADHAPAALAAAGEMRIAAAEHGFTARASARRSGRIAGRHRTRPDRGDGGVLPLRRARHRGRRHRPGRACSRALGSAGALPDRGLPRPGPPARGRHPHRPRPLRRSSRSVGGRWATSGSPPGPSV